MKKGIFLFLFTAKLLFAQNFTLENISFIQQGETSKIILQFDKPGVSATRFHVDKDKQIIVDLKDVKADSKIMRAFDASEFTGSVVFVSPYKKPNNPDDIRVAIQLRDNVRSILEAQDNRIVLNVENRFGVFSQARIEDEAQEKTQTIGESSAVAVNIPKSDSVEDILENLTKSGRKRYIGKRIYFDVKDIAVADLMKMIADASGFNIIVGEDVKKVPPVTLTLTNIPWDQALDTVLELSKLVATKNGNILMVQTLAKATEERKVELEAELLLEQQEPLVTKVFPISFADVKELPNILKEYLTEERGKISIDERTNNLIIKDTVDAIERMRRIIDVLDRQTPQVLIEAKVVEALEGFSQRFGLRNGVTANYQWSGPAQSQNQDTPDTGASFAISSASVGGQNASSVLGIAVSVFKRIFDLDLTLELLESESKGRIVSTPKVITQNKKEAEIINRQQTSFLVVQTDPAGNRLETFQQLDVDLALKVTPQVTNDGSIVMEVNLEKGSFRPAQGEGPPDVIDNTIKTNVLVDNGSTVVIGGIYTYEERENHSGVPFLKDIPLLGWLFRTSYNPEKTKQELIIFLTPRVINQEEAGLTDTEPLG